MSPNGDSFRELCQRKLYMQLSILERTDRYEFQSLGELYDGTTRHLHVPHDIAKGLATGNINGNRSLWVEVRSIGKEYSDAAYLHRSSGRQGILLCYENFKYRDVHTEGMKSSIRGRVAIFLMATT